MSPTVFASMLIANLSPPPETFNFSKDVIDKWAQFPELKAMIWTSATDPLRRDLSFKHFSDYSHRVAKWMSDRLGIRKGDRIIIMLPRLPEWWEIVLVSLAQHLLLEGLIILTPPVHFFQTRGQYVSERLSSLAPFFLRRRISNFVWMLAVPRCLSVITPAQINSTRSATQT